ncbi:hypothetical protein SISNIDRAFT_181868 [Sistotremastrum niveocremeum HHB9708]|uniref:DEAD-box helicase OB fold domain-containing protein n=1 Tax=Sistotremastrum niveocremeum HHB9708 TaxID=1314777 RepID=A0A164RFY9_9AGAM|nr:hypothetical protein SISNIDRAFT_181868 [Sistotremastrum niveocremeum HHB9708]
MKTHQTVYIHPSSSLFQFQPPVKCVLYYELVMTSKSYLRYVFPLIGIELFDRRALQIGDGNQASVAAGGRATFLQVSLTDAFISAHYSDTFIAGKRIWNN